MKTDKQYECLKYISPDKFMDVINKLYNKEITSVQAKKLIKDMTVTAHYKNEILKSIKTLK